MNDTNDDNYRPVREIFKEWQDLINNTTQMPFCLEETAAGEYDVIHGLEFFSIENIDLVSSHTFSHDGVVDIYFQPTRPVEYITLTLTVTFNYDFDKFEEVAKDKPVSSFIIDETDE